MNELMPDVSWKGDSIDTKSEPAPEQMNFTEVITRMTDLAKQIDLADSNKERIALRLEHQEAIAEFSRIQDDMTKLGARIYSEFGSGSVAEA